MESVIRDYWLNWGLFNSYYIVYTLCRVQWIPADGDEGEGPSSEQLNGIRWLDGAQHNGNNKNPIQSNTITQRTVHSQWGVVFVVLCGGINRTVSSGGGGGLTVVAEHEKEEVQLKISRLIFLLPPSGNSIQFPPSSTSRSCSHGGTHSLTHCSTRDGSRCSSIHCWSNSRQSYSSGDDYTNPCKCNNFDGYSRTRFITPLRGQLWDLIRSLLYSPVHNPYVIVLSSIIFCLQI